MFLDYKHIPLSGVVKNRDYFFDREDEIEEIVELIENGADIAVIGEHEIGKSSILWQIYMKAENRDILEGWEVIYIDLQRFEKKEALVRRMLDELGVSVDKSADYSELKIHFEKAISHKKVVLILDEFDKVRELPKVFDKSFRDWLRSLAQSREFDLVISMREEPSRVLSKDTGFTSPFYNIFQIQRIEPFDLETVRKYVQSFGFSPEVGEKIYKLTKGHPRRVNLAIRAFGEWQKDPKVQAEFKSWEKYYEHRRSIYEPPEPSRVRVVLGPVKEWLSRISLCLIGFLATAMITDDQLYSLVSKVFHTDLPLSGFHFYLFLAMLILLSASVGFLTATLGLDGLLKLLLSLR